MQKQKKDWGSNKRGLTGPLIAVFIMIGVILAIMVLFFIWGLAGPEFVSIVGDITEVFEETAASEEPGGPINESVAVTFRVINPAVQNLKWLSYTLLVFLLIGFFFLAFWVRTYPFLIIFWVGAMIVLIFAAVFMADAYNDIANNDPKYQEWGTNHFILTNLPFIFTAVGFLGGFILFILASRDTEAEQETVF